MYLHQIMKIVGITLCVGFSGCAGLNSPLPPKQIQSQTNSTVDILYQFNDDINDNPLSKNDIIKNIINHMSNNSGYKNKQSYRNKSVSFSNIKGKTINFNNNILTINYVNGDNNCYQKCENGESLTKVIFESSMMVEINSKNIFNIRADFPTQYIVKAHTDAIGIEHPLLDNLSILEKDAKEMFDSLKNKPIIIERQVEFKGEINTQYPDKSIYANFKRLMGLYSWGGNESITESKKQNSFNLIVANKSYPLHIEVYPYRDGSKVNYSATLFYQIDSAGNSTLTSKDIKELHKKIEKIIND
ncbi:MAG: hypothetical protein JW802_08560 [Campylobacterales bacterium]|nr:hypothetical protein [Campylobacterales bacterium]